MQRQSALGGKRTSVVPTRVAVLADAQTDVQPVGLVAELEEEIPHGERVLAPAHRHEDAVVRANHVEVGDRLLHLPAAQLLQVLGAEVGIVAGQIDHRRPATHPALAHRCLAIDRRQLDRTRRRRAPVSCSPHGGDQCAVMMASSLRSLTCHPRR